MPNGGMRKKRDHYRKQGGFEHDDRMPAGAERVIFRKVSFKNNQGGRKDGKQFNRQKGWDAKIRQALLEEDIDMGGSQQQQHQHQGGGRHPKHFNRNNGNFRNGNFKGNKCRKLTESPTYWYKVSLQNGHKYEKELILRLINSHIKPVPFDPIGYEIVQEEASFIVGEYKQAEAIMRANHQITLPGNWKLQIRVRPITPIIEIDDYMTSAIKEALATRYNATAKSLNLASFHKDNAFAKRSMFCPLNRPNIMTTVINIVGESAPDLVALDLSDNKINVTDHMKIMIEKMPQLKCLHIGKNKLRDIKALNPLRGLSIVELVLDGNSLCDRYKEQDAYIRAVRDIFPKVIKLDQVELPPPILFVDEEVSQLPPVQASFMCDTAGSAMVRQFLEQYYLLYDSTDRSPIAQAYHEEAEFSMCLSPFSDPPTYASENRNVLKWPAIERKIRTLKKGRYGIVNFFNTLPETQHDPSSFAVDLIVYSPQVIQMVIMGVFRDKDGKKNPIRSFSRVFVIVPVGTGYCITNEMLSITPPTKDQLSKAFKPVVVPEAVSTALASINLTPDNSEIEIKKQMVTNLALKTGMNLLWSEKCLTETNWNYEQAEFAFTQLHKAGSIPPEAFIK